LECEIYNIDSTSFATSDIINGVTVISVSTLFYCDMDCNQYNYLIQQQNEVPNGTNPYNHTQNYSSITLVNDFSSILQDSPVLYQYLYSSLNSPVGSLVYLNKCIYIDVQTLSTF
jgi:hypothetical protein